MDDYIWLTERARRREAAWAITGSLLTHAIMLFILTFTDVSVPLTGMAGKKLDIVWLSPLSLTDPSLADQPLEHPEAPKVERQPGPEPKAGERETAGQVVEVSAVAAVSMQVNVAPSITGTAAGPGKGLHKDAGAFRASPPAGPADAADARDPGESDVGGVSRVSADREVVVAAVQGEYGAPAERDATNGHAPKQVLAGMNRPERTARPDDHLHQPGVSGKSGSNTSELPPQAVSMQKQLFPPVAAIPPEASSKGDATVAVAQKQESIPSVAPAAVPATAKVESSKRPAAAGIVYPSVNGDLKLVIQRSSGARLLVAFRELPKSKRNAPQTRAQSGVQKQVIPIYYKTEEGAAEAVIKVGQEGVYTFRVEDVTPEASVTLRLFEGSAKEKAAPLRGGGASQRQLLVKVLMPEGILWNDDAAFTGSLEDSNSTTKFNAQTGLYWREYRD